MTKKYILVLAILLSVVYFSGCVQVNNYYYDSTDNPSVFNRALSGTEVKEIYISTTQHDCRIATDEGYWYFNDDSENIWAFKDYPQRILITIRTSEANFSEDFEDGFWWIPKDKLSLLPIDDVKFTTIDGDELDFSDNNLMNGSWYVEGFTLYKDKDTQLYIYLKANCDPKYQYKEMKFYPKEED